MKLLVYKIIQFRIGYSKTLKEKTPVDILAPFNPKFLYHLFEFSVSANSTPLWASNNVDSHV